MHACCQHLLASLHCTVDAGTLALRVMVGKVMDVEQVSSMFDACWPSAYLHMHTGMGGAAIVRQSSAG
jgi:hypothetical protein